MNLVSTYTNLPPASTVNTMQSTDWPMGAALLLTVNQIFLHVAFDTTGFFVDILMAEANELKMHHQKLTLPNPCPFWLKSHFSKISPSGMPHRRKTTFNAAPNHRVHNAHTIASNAPDANPESSTSSLACDDPVATSDSLTDSSRCLHSFVCVAADAPDAKPQKLPV